MTVDSPNLEYARRFARTWAQEFLTFKDELRNAVARKSMDKTRTDLSRQEERVFEARQRLEDYLQERPHSRPRRTRAMPPSSRWSGFRTGGRASCWTGSAWR